MTQGEEYGHVLRELARLERQVKRRTWVDVGGILTLVGLALGIGQCALEDRDQVRAVAYGARNTSEVVARDLESHERRPSHDKADEAVAELREIKVTLTHLQESTEAQRQDMAELRRLILRRARARQ